MFIDSEVETYTSTYIQLYIINIVRRYYLMEWIFNLKIGFDFGFEHEQIIG